MNSVDSISATLARIVRLNLSRSAFKRQASTADAEMSQPSYTLLRVLIDEGPQPTGQLAKMAHMDVGMTTRRVQALVKAGLISRHADLDDGRVSIVQATAAGEKAAAALQDLRREHLARALSGWSAADLQELDRLLARFLNDTKQTPIVEY
ncbi:winged helix-turn-helix transcriptional regulator [Mycobacterium sp. CBMA247]|nr:winged helix-turn-helix transcriptional regulator [Mycolicibacterium sp. CBMA 329]MUL90987.1 winged helix-turn-helix transcriptional regulator [Mycolicibacterium sp. CBMA 331]MUL98342.1 winged helix-turn-helix transcriptional regulator [Mycolicibacterium sp. CBMA 334]MUM28605.1 winged helix-turn-helix transcriptional regulator [Mycolicibacterium sp. CBMA 295]MUM40746.1 winged helix-turn-helix transcriptional regulator [Mycolicibacterium sp. CBMA 247]MUM46942.1 winged helix-turn-helix transc